MKQRLHPDDLEFYLKSNEKRLYRLAYSYMHSDADAKDMLQNAILKAFTGLTRLKNMEYMDTWFYRILINTCLDQIRKQRRESVYPLEEDIMLQEHTDMLLSEELHQLLFALDPKTRTILILRFFEDRKLDEISDILSMPLSTVKTRLYKGLKDMRIQKYRHRRIWTALWIPASIRHRKSRAALPFTGYGSLRSVLPL